jgi:IS605 OrfB family transposase
MKLSKRKLKKVSGKKQRFRTDINYCVSKYLVEKAKDINVGIVLEDLSGITKRITVRKTQRAKRHSWSFYQLRQFITYKAKLKGFPVVVVDPRNISRQCSECGHIAKANRKNQVKFCSKKCGYSENADYNAAKNIAARAVSTSLLLSAKKLSKVA